MSRSSQQGLQILLIFFVMLSVVLGVTTYLYSKKATEETGKAVAAANQTTTAKNETKVANDECAKMRQLLGQADWNFEQLKKQSDDDQQLVGVNPKADGNQKTPEVIGYIQMVAALANARDGLQSKCDAEMKKYEKNLEDYESREKASTAAVAQFDAKQGELVVRVNAIDSHSASVEKELVNEQGTVTPIITQVKKEEAEKVSEAERKRLAQQQLATLAQKDRKDLIDKIRRMDRPQMDVPSGEIKWVDLDGKTVWIDRGRADYLQQQTRFTVFSAESNDVATAVKKGTIEVVRILGDHKAECRIVDEKMNDPMMYGDKVFTALWSPGQQNHFALSGLINLDGDGRNQVDAAVALIRSGGGAVDCWLDDSGHRHGIITSGTQWLIVGDPLDHSSAQMNTANTEIINDAKRNFVREMPLSEFKQKINYQKTNSVEHFGRGASNTDVDRAASAAKAPAAKPVSNTGDAGFQ